MSTRPTKPGQVSVYKVLEERGYINQTIGYVFLLLISFFDYFA